MKREILTSTAVDPLGHGLGRHLHRGPVGRYADRLVAIIQSSANQIVLTYADPPYVSWSTPINIAIDAADLPFDSVIKPDGSILVVYTENGTDSLVARPLTFVNGQWSPGLKSVIYDGAISQFPSIAIDDNDHIWVAWTRSAGAVKYIHVKSSSDNGVTWGTGSADAGTQLTFGASSVYARLTAAPDALHVVYTEADWNILIRTRPSATGNWDSAYVIAGSDVNGAGFDVAVSKSGLLGVVFDRYGLQYREYDGSIWHAIQTLDEDGGSSPHLQFQGDLPVVSYLSEVGVGGRSELKFVTRVGGDFGEPAPLDTRTGAFAALLLYSAFAENYHDATAAASDDTVGNVYHPATNSLLNQSGDRIYLGLNDRFRIVHVTLATAGIGGTVSFSYWDGASWKTLDPDNGPFNFDDIERTIVLWPDYHGIPQNWQQSVVGNTRLYWIKIEATVAYTTPPVGTRLDASAPITALSVRR